MGKGPEWSLQASKRYRRALKGRFKVLVLWCFLLGSGKAEGAYVSAAPEFAPKRQQHACLYAGFSLK